MIFNYVKLDKNEKIITKNSFNAKRNFNYGLAILKTLLAFSVVIAHNFKKKTTKNEIILKITEDRKLHVPSFFIMSFYFTCNDLLSLNVKLLFKRMIRLLLPYISWPIIIFTINNIVNLKYKKKLFPDTFQLLKLQLLWGSSYMAQFWFQWNLIVITFLFYIIKAIFQKNVLSILQFLLILSYISQYSGYYYKNYFRKFPSYNKYTISRLFEMIPFGVTGINLGLYKVIKYLQEVKVKTFIFSVVIYNVVKEYNIFTDIKGVSYYGINLNIESICLIFIFSLFPLNNITNNFLKKLLVLLTNYTAGIFYLHVSVRNYLKYFINDIKNGTFFGLIINYFICYCICQFGMFFFSKTQFQYLFC